MASYLGIAAGQIPAKHYFGPVRTFYNDNCDYSWTETKPVGAWKTYHGIPVFEGALPYRGMQRRADLGRQHVRGADGAAVRARGDVGPASWGVNHPLYVRGQIEHGLDEAKYGYWGFSPSNNPAGGYREYGVDALGMDAGSRTAGGYTCDQERTDCRTSRYEGCRDGDATPPPTAYGDGVVTPHASFLAYRYAPEAALANLRQARARTSTPTVPAASTTPSPSRSGQVSKRYLSLDQGMIMAALGNALAGDDMRRYVSQGRDAGEARAADAARGLHGGGALMTDAHDESARQDWENRIGTRSGVAFGGNAPRLDPPKDLEARPGAHQVTLTW